MLIETLSLGDLVELSAALRRAGDGAANMEQAAQRIVRVVHDRLGAPDGSSACLLVRLFKTHRFDGLEDELRNLAAAMLRREGHPATPETACLTLLATVGAEPAWCDRSRSLAHRVIPLPSRAAIQRTPMVAALLSQVGVDLDAVASATLPHRGGPAGHRFGVFHVEDAVGSPHVPAQDDFVARYGVRSVLGFGGMLPSGDVFAVVLFSRVTIPRRVAELFRPVAQSVNLALLPFAAGPVFATSTPAVRVDPAVEASIRLAAFEQLLSSHEDTTREQSRRLEEDRAALGRVLAELRRSEARYESLVRASAQIVWRTDAAGMVTELPEWRAVTGQSADEVRGAGWLDAVHPDERARATASWQDAVAAGTTFVAEFRLRYADGAYHPVVARGVPLVEAARVSEWVGMCVDVSELRREEAERRVAHERLALVANAGQQLAAKLDVDATVATLCSLLVPALADLCSVHLRDDDGSIRLVSARHADPTLAPALAELLGSCTISTDQPYGAGYAIATGRSQLMPSVDDAVLRALSGADAAALARFRTLKIASGFIVALRVRGRVIGAVSLASAGTPLTDTERGLAEDIARRAALAIDNAQLFEAQRAVAVSLQQGLLPELPVLPGLAVAARYVASTAAAAVGGDWYDAFSLPDGATGLAIGDVMGHDLSAAAAMGQLRSALRTAAWDGERPAQVLDRLDRLVQGFGMADLATVCYGRLDPIGADGRASFRYANAGHLPPLLIPPAGEPMLLTDGRSVLIGVPGGEHRAEGVARFPAGTTLVCYTDGLVEQPGADIDDGLERLRRVAADYPRDGNVDELCAHLLAAVRPADTRDDVALLAVRILRSEPADARA